MEKLTKCPLCNDTKLEETIKEVVEGAVFWTSLKFYVAAVILGIAVGAIGYRFIELVIN